MLSAEVSDELESSDDAEDGGMTRGWKWNEVLSESCSMISLLHAIHHNACWCRLLWILAPGVRRTVSGS